MTELPHIAVTEFLRRLVRRARRLLILELALVWGAVLSAGVLTASLLGSRGLGAGWAQTLFFAAVMGAPVMYLSYYLIPRFLPLRTVWRAAAYVDDRGDDQPGASLRSAVELGGDDGLWAGQSAALAEAATRQAAEGLAATDLRALAPGDGARRALMAFMVSSMALLLALVLVPDRVQGGLSTFFARPADAVVVAPPVDTDDGPALGDIKLTLSYPAYLNRETSVFENSTGRVLAPLGTVVAVEARVSSRADTADLAVGDGAPVAAVMEEGGRLSGQFTVTGEGAYRFLLRRGGDVEPTRRYPIEVEVDGHPTVEMAGVESGAELAQTEGLAFAFSARDDHGLTELSFGVALEGRESRRVITDLPDAPDAYSGDATWFPAEWEIPPGSEVEVWLEVKDNDTVSGPKVGSSRRVKVRIASDAQRHEKTLALKEEMKEHLLTALAEQLVWSITPTRQLAAPAVDQQRKKGIELMEPVLEGFRTLKEAAGSDAMEEIAVYQALMATERDVVQSWDELEAASGLLLAELGQTRMVLKRSAAEAAAAVDSARLRLVSGLERAVLSMESFANLQRLEDILAGGDRLRDAADELREMLANAEDVDMEAMLSKVDNLESELAKMAQKMAQLDQQSAAWFQNPQQQTQEMKNALDEIRELMKQGKTEEAKAALEAYMQQLEEMMAELEGMKEEEFGEVRDQASRDIGNVIDGLKQLEQDQGRLAQDAEAVAAMTEEQAGVGAQALKEALKEAEARVARIEAGLDKAHRAAEASPPGYATEQQLKQAREDTRMLEAALKSQDVMRSLRHAEDVTGETQWLKARGQNQGPSEPQARRDFQGGTAEAAEEAAALRDELQELAQRMQQARSQAAAQSGGVADRQKGLGREAGDVAQTLEEFSKDSPYVPAEWGEQMQQASRNMQAASEKLQQGSMRGAATDQRAAEQTVRSIREQMEAARDALEAQQRGMAQGQPQGGQPQMAQGPGQGQMQPGEGEQPGQRDSEDWGGRHSSKGRVQILQQGTGAKEYREALMEGMRGETPERYERQNRAYYERLVK